MQDKPPKELAEPENPLSPAEMKVMAAATAAALCNPATDDTDERKAVGDAVVKAWRDGKRNPAELEQAGRSARQGGRRPAADA